MEQVTSDHILAVLKGWVEEKRSIPAEKWMDAALKLSILLEDEHLALIDVEQAYANVKLDTLKTMKKPSVAMAEAMSEVSPEYRALRLQKLKVDRIEEMQRLAKRYASINEFK